MQRLTLYLLAELLKAFTLALSATTLFMMIVVVAYEAFRQGVGLGPLLRLIPYGLPDALRFAVPATTLLAICTVFGRMSSDNEFLAIKSAGISPMVMVYPTLVMTFLVSLVAVWINDLAVSWGEPGTRRVIIESVENIAYRMLRARRSYSRDGFSISVAGVEGRTLIRPMLVYNASDTSEERILTAREAELHRDPEHNTLVIRLTDGRVEAGDLEVLFDGPEEGVVPLLDAGGSFGRSSSPSHLPFGRIPHQIKDQRVTLHERRRACATVAACQMLTGALDELTSPAWIARQAQMTADFHRLRHLQAVPWRRWANGFSCLFFAMVGVPLAIRMRNGNLFTTFAACFLPILLVYYPLLAYGVDRAKCGALPPYGVWLGNAICCAVGLVLLRGTQRY